MRTDRQRYRFLRSFLERYTSRHLIVLTGARQTGKTTLARSVFPHLNYVNLDAVEQREAVRAVRTSEWALAVGPAVLDEAQKEPSVFEKVKYAFDDGSLDQTVLLGSSQILMLQRVRETLAGRAFVFELWPLMAIEIATPVDTDTPRPPLLDLLLTEPGNADLLLSDTPRAYVGRAEDDAAAAVEHLLTWGGMPALLPLPDEERRKWLQSYGTTYLERDLGDLARMADLVPFRQFERLCALRTGQLLSYSEIARFKADRDEAYREFIDKCDDFEREIAKEQAARHFTYAARRYVEYLRLSYQALLLLPYATNLTSAVVKAPKVFWGDLGTWRQLTHYHGPVTGPMFETLVVTEIHKWVRTAEREVEMAFYRTRAGLEVDLLLTTPHGVWGIEAKAARRLATADWRALRLVGRALGGMWRGGLVVYRGTTIERLADDIWAVPASRLLVTP